MKDGKIERYGEMSQSGILIAWPEKWDEMLQILEINFFLVTNKENRTNSLLLWTFS